MAPPRPADVVVLAGGERVPDRELPPLPAGAWVVAADAGLGLARRLGCDADLVVGDLDSVAADDLAAARAAGARVERHPRDKDATDLALALDAALRRAPADVLVVGGHGGRLDHLLGNALLLADERYAPLRLTAHVGPAVLAVVRDEAELTGTPGELVSLLPAHGPARGVTTEGLRWRLTGEELPAGTTRGVSNELLGTRAEVHVDAGVLLAVQPGVAAPATPDDEDEHP